MVTIRIPVPRIPPGLLSNLLGLLGLVAVAVALGGLLHNWWWSVLAGGVSAVVLASVAQRAEQAETVRKPLAAVPKAA